MKPVKITGKQDWDTLMAELEKRGYLWHAGNKPTSLDYTPRCNHIVFSADKRISWSFASEYGGISVAGCLKQLAIDDLKDKAIKVDRLEDWQPLMRYLEGLGMKWASGLAPTKWNPGVVPWFVGLEGCVLVQSGAGNFSDPRDRSVITAKELLATTDRYGQLDHEHCKKVLKNVQFFRCKSKEECDELMRILKELGFDAIEND